MQGFLLISDITGYTGFLSASELEHAQGILTPLLELLIDHNQPPLVISRLAGDAVISYGLPDNFFQQQTFIESLEDTYVAFRKALERLALNNTCCCNACANISGLDLKFFVHYGEFALQRLSQHDELVGSDVNLIHRLLKNHVTEQTAIRAYILYTDAALIKLGLQGSHQAFTGHTEEYEHLGRVQTWLQDMHPVWSSKKSAVRQTIPPDQVLARASIDLAMPPALAWDYLGQLEFRKTLLASDRQEVTKRQDGRVEAGSIYQCYHGDQVIPQTVLEWQPFEQILTQSLISLPGMKAHIRMELQLEETSSGTRLTQTLAKASGPFLARKLVDREVKRSEKYLPRDLQAFKKRIESDLAEHRAGQAASSAIAGDLVRQAVADSLAERTGSA